MRDQDKKKPIRIQYIWLVVKNEKDQTKYWTNEKIYNGILFLKLLCYILQ